MNEIKNMQDNLLLIRRAVGWTAQEFGDLIGVTRQTINNIENGRNKLSKTQYIAMRCVLDAEIEKNPEDTQMLRAILELFVDNPEAYKESEREALKEKAELISPAILAGSSRKVVSKEFIKSAALIMGAGALGLTMGAASAIPAGGAGAIWLGKILKDGKKPKK